jgi:uncharacterized protein YidB (DUF937 family)
MGLLDSVMSAVGQHENVNPQQHATLVQSAMEMFGNHQGLSGLLNNAHSQGLGGVVQSWIGTGNNQQISPQQVPNVVGQDRVNEIARRAGVSPGIAGAALAHILPVLIDRFTPNGQIPRAA